MSVAVSASNSSRSSPTRRPLACFWLPSLCFCQEEDPAPTPADYPDVGLGPAGEALPLLTHLPLLPEPPLPVGVPEGSDLSAGCPLALAAASFKTSDMRNSLPGGLASALGSVYPVAEGRLGCCFGLNVGGSRGATCVVSGFSSCRAFPQFK